jgi:hypothetical protein
MKNKQKGFVIPLIIAIIAILGIGGGVYVYTNKKVVNPPVTNVSEVVGTTPAPIIKDEPKAVATTSTTVQKTNPVAQVSNTTNVSIPKETFIKFRTEFDATKTFDEAFAVTIKYSTKEKSDFYKSQQSQVTEDMKTQLFPSLKSMMPPMSTITIVNENITGDIALLSLKTNIPPKTALVSSSQTGTVTLKKESGVWKIEGESWK